MYSSAQKLVADGRPINEWKFTINTEAKASGEKTTGIPLNLYNVNGTMDVDWGDGTITILTSTNYTSNDSRASLHEYTNPGIYHITMTSRDWNLIYLHSMAGDYTVSSSNNAIIDLYWFKRTLISVENAIPKNAGFYRANYSGSISISQDIAQFFYGCESLTTIPSDLFSNIKNSSDFYRCFCDCKNITSIPSGLFDTCINVTSFNGCFQSCSSIASIPAGLFDNNTKVTNFEGCFWNCKSITSIPSGLFDKNVLATNLGSIFRGTSITSIPSGLFDKNVLATNLGACFSECTVLQSIPAGIFDKNVLATNLSSCFNQCSKITSIPQGLFDNNTEVIYLSGCFRETKITSIPQGLFDNNTEVTTFFECFRGCSSITSIPQGLFDNNIKATNFSGCFRYCQIKSLPDDLFKYNVLATSFNECFASTSLEYISPTLFAYNPAITSLYSCLSVSSLKNFKLIINSELVSDFSSFVSNTSNVTRIICVPANSTTYTTLSNYAQIGSSKNNITVSTTNLDCVQTLEYTVDTEATTTNATIATIPVQSVQNASSKLMIDWGDGNGVELLPSEITMANLTHTYSAAGEYQITVGAVNWLDYQFLADSNPSSSNTLIQTFRNILISIDEAIPPISNTTLDYWFYNCTHLESYSSHIFDNLPNVTSSISTFNGCTALTAISAGTLRKQENLTNAASMFEGCSVVTYIPSGLISQCRQLTNATQMFKNCTSLTYYPNTLLLNNTTLTTRTNMFSGCSNTNPTFYTKAQLESNGYYVELFDTEAYEENGDKIGIPVNLAGNSETLTVTWGDSSTSVLSASNYTEADSTASIHTYANLGLYFVSMQSTNWANTTLCQLVHFQLHESASYFNNATLPTFYRQTTLIEAPVKIPFYKEKKQYGSFDATSFAIAFAGAQYMGKIVYHYLNCKWLKFVCSNLFSDLVEEISFYECFYGCTSLQSIPSGLFDKNTQVDVFTACFFNCSSIQSIPSGLFDSNTVATKFGSCFYGCSYLQSIPSGLFNNNTQVDTFTACFRECSSIQSIPAGLFDKNTLVTFFNDCFYNCSSIQSIPAGLFDKNILVKGFRYCFYNCSSIQSIPSGLFDKNTAVTDFESCFSKCSSIQSIPSNLFINNTAATTFSYCFYNCSALTDFTLTIGSSSVSSCSSFVTKKTGTTRTVYVPASSTTYTTFSNQATTLGLTVIGE